MNTQRYYLCALLAGLLTLVGCQQATQPKSETPATAQTEASQTAEGTVMPLTKATFDQQVAQVDAKSFKFLGQRPVVIDFYATWCGPCKMVAPVMDNLAKAYAGKVDFYKVDIDQESELADLFGVQVIPTFLYIDHAGRPTLEQGVQTKEGFEKKINSLLKP